MFQTLQLNRMLHFQILYRWDHWYINFVPDWNHPFLFNLTPSYIDNLDLDPYSVAAHISVQYLHLSV